MENRIVDTEKIESGYAIQNILLMESSFNRVVEVSFDQEKISNTLNINVDFNIEGDEIYVSETLDYIQVYEGAEQVKAKINYVGVFKKIGTPSVDVNVFGKVNGAAILFPYIREHLSNLSIKAGLNMILIPPMNFSAPKTEK